MTKTKTLHQSVLLKSVLATLKPQKGDNYLDLTAGMGGHAREIFKVSQNYQKSVLVDRDQFAISQLKDLKQNGVQIINQDFLTASKQLIAQNYTFDLILIDLGVSSPQFDQIERGFSFSKEARLDMRMDERSTLDAEKIINHYSKDRLSQIFIDYGEVKAKIAQKVALEIVKNRPINTTTELANLISHVIKRRGKIHPATVFFQAIRIEVNDELNQLQQTLELLPQLLKPGGRLAIISFHSLEDRLVKNFFKQEFDKGLISQLEPVTKKPILGSIEDVPNPRSRSAILRVVKKQK